MPSVSVCTSLGDPRLLPPSGYVGAYAFSSARGVGKFADAIDSARRQVATISDERLKTSLFEIGKESRGRKNSGMIKVQPTAPGRRASSSRGRAPIAAGRPMADAGPMKKRELPHSLKEAVASGRRGSYNH